MSCDKRTSGSLSGLSQTGFILPCRDSPHPGVAIPPPNIGIKSSGKGLSKQGYSTMTAISQNALSASTSWAASKKRIKTEDEYFDEEEEDVHQTNSLEYIPAPGSPTDQTNSNSKTQEEVSSDSDDPLDAFMEGINREYHKDLKKSEKNAGLKEQAVNTRGIRDDIDEEDDEESYYKYMEANPQAGLKAEGSDIEMEYDEDGVPIGPVRSKDIDPLPPIDHSEIEYTEFEKNFYSPHEDIVKLTSDKVNELRKTLGIKVTGAQPPHPLVSFGYFGFDEALMKTIRKSEFSTPTPIQAQAVPAALSGRDVIGIAKTGSGKTAAFVWPMLIHIMDQSELKPGDGPIGLILAPTRELSQQIYTEAKKFGKVYNIQVTCCYGGGNKWEQSKALENGAEIVVATPGRMIDLIKMKATNLSRVTFMVLDEADRMFDMGFEPQVKSICNHVRPDRQTLLFSATFKKKVERLARMVMTDPIRIVQGDVGEANEDVIQNIVILPNQNAKFPWLVNHIVQFLSAGSLLVFVNKKVNAEEVANNLKLKEFEVLLLHGDLDQIERNKVITQFKKKIVSILVATDVAARGLDIPHIRTVVNYDLARDIDTHTHRIGRTGRAGERGYAYSLVLNQDKEFVGHLVRNLEGANQEVPKSLLDLALQSSWFRKSRFKNGKAKQLNIGGCGLGYRERPGLGSSSSTVADVTKCGPVSERLSAMKATFKSRYLKQFKRSSDQTWEHTRDQTQKDSEPVKTKEPEIVQPKRNKKSRWDST